jgi:RHS repeat-associated protein
VTDSYSGTTITNPGNAALILYGPTAGVFAGQWGLSSTITNGSFLLGGTFQNSPGQPRSGWVYTTGPCPGPPTCSGNQYSGLYSITPLTGGSSALTQTVTTTAAGNVASFTPAFGTVTNLAYNQANRLATVIGANGQLVQYTYDAFGRRVVKFGVSTATTLYQYDRAGHLLEENDGLGTSRVDYVYLDDRPIATIQPSVGQVYFLHDDRLGAPQLATDANQTVQWTATYQPFGYTSTAVGLIVQDLRMPGQEFDLETGLYHNGFRDYAPGLGRYLESDPIGLAGGANTYVYVGANPETWTDKSGSTIDYKNIVANVYGCWSNGICSTAVDVVDNFFSSLYDQIKAGGVTCEASIKAGWNWLLQEIPGLAADLGEGGGVAGPLAIAAPTVNLASQTMGQVTQGQTLATAPLVIGPGGLPSYPTPYEKLFLPPTPESQQK